MKLHQPSYWLGVFMTTLGGVIGIWLASCSAHADTKPKVTRRIPEQLWKMPVYVPVPTSDLEKLKVKDRTPKYKIGILDTGISNADLLVPVKLCKTGHYDFSTDTKSLGSSLDHGSVIASIIASELEGVDYCFVIYQLMDDMGQITVENTTKALKMAEKEGLIAINMSLTGVGHSFEEKNVFKELHAKGVTVFAAAGNDHRNLNNACLAYPACYDGVKAVGALSPDSTQRATYSNYGARVKLWYPGDVNTGVAVEQGTSFAAPRALADFVRSLSLLGKK